jgi:hypothetical protein
MECGEDALPLEVIRLGVAFAERCQMGCVAPDVPCQASDHSGIGKSLLCFEPQDSSQGIEGSALCFWHWVEGYGNVERSGGKRK